MNHVAEGTLMGYLDGALPHQERAEVDRHLESCSACAFEAEELRIMAREFSTAVAVADTAIPLLTARASIEDQIAPPRTVEFSPWRKARRSTAFLKAAAVVLLVAGGASAAIPGSPLNRFAAQIASLASRLVSGEPEVTAPEVAIPQQQVPAATPVWFVEPANNRIRISIRGMSDGLRMTVRLVDEPNATVSAPGSQDQPGVRKWSGTLDIANVSSDLIIEIPRGVNRATVEVNGVPYYVKNGSDVRILQAAMEAATDEYVFTARS
jgi:hypothetical protein